ncbi:IclR family transcriptional regulator [Ottowia testudinis]|uniref:IclR family transcriptional regulator n=1 Tax=Ottowia testudinis TaxID=2816950 RepID=A0A975H4P9_9BURK|nr:IclR family transcriptional regulator [Ottowia testudinis]QTD46546.1 IclR family transcriptional regulator [Ottowia testudinis]
MHAPASEHRPAPRNTEDRNPNFVYALAKGLEILAAFSEGELLGNQQLVERTGLPKATVSRLTSTLVQLGYLRLDPITRKLCMGNRLVGMGMRVQRHIGLHRAARPFMERLANQTGLTVSFGTRDRLGIVFLEVLRPDAATRLVTNTGQGSVLPLEQTSIGLAYIVGAPVKEQTSILDGLRRRASTPWDTVRQQIERAHQEYDRHGFVTYHRSLGREVSGVGVPLMLPRRNALYAFHCAGPASGLTLARLRHEVGPQLLATVRDIRAAMLEPAARS